MTSPDLEIRSLRQRRLALGGIALGVVFTGLSFWPELSAGGDAWTTDQALQYQAAAAKVIGLSHTLDNASPDTTSRDSVEDAQKTLREYSNLRQQLDSARSRSLNWAFVLRAMGIILAAVSGATFIAAGREH